MVPMIVLTVRFKFGEDALDVLALAPSVSLCHASTGLGKAIGRHPDQVMLGTSNTGNDVEARAMGEAYRSGT